jgi:hypothetical protein
LLLLFTVSLSCCLSICHGLPLFFLFYPNSSYLFVCQVTSKGKNSNLFDTFPKEI